MIHRKPRIKLSVYGLWIAFTQAQLITFQEEQWLAAARRFCVDRNFDEDRM